MKTLFDYYEGDEERCGFILLDGEILEVANVHPQPDIGFEIDPATVLEHLNRISGIWHTHPKGLSVLSGDDLNYMKMWPKIDHIIIGEDGIRTYASIEDRVTDENFLPRPTS